MKNTGKDDSCFNPNILREKFLGTDIQRYFTVSFSSALVAKYVLLPTGVLTNSNADYAEKNSNVSLFS